MYMYVYTHTHTQAVGPGPGAVARNVTSAARSVFAYWQIIY